MIKMPKVYGKYFINYFIGFIVLLIFCGFMMWAAYDSVKDYMEQTSRSRLKEGINSIEEDISRLDMTAQIISKNTSYNVLLQAKGSLEKEKVMNLKYVCDQFREIVTSWGDGANQLTPYGFLLFQNNELFVTTQLCGFEYSNFYGNYLSIMKDGTIVEAEKLKEILFSEAKGLINFVPVQKVTYIEIGGKVKTIEDAILCVIKNTKSEDVITVYVISKEVIVNRLLAENMQPEAFVWIKDGEDDLIKLESSSSNNYYNMSYYLEDIGWDITVGMPVKMINRQIAPVAKTFLVYIGLGLIGMVCVSLYVSGKQYKKVWNLFAAVSNEAHSIGKNGDEYEVLYKIFKEIEENNIHYQDRIAQTIQQNKAILLDNLIVKGIVTKAEQETIAEMFDDTVEFFCVALIYMEAEKQAYHMNLLYITKYMEEKLEREFIQVHIDEKEEALIFALNPKDAPNTRVIRECLETVIMALMETRNTVFQVGISSVGTGLENINVCYHQAKQVLYAYGNQNESFVECYKIDINAARENIVNMEYMNKFYQLLICGEIDGIFKNFEKLKNYYEKMPALFETQKQQTFFSLRNIIYTAYLNYPEGQSQLTTLPEYKMDYTLIDMIGVLEDAVSLFCKQLADRRQSEDNELKDKVMYYINENFHSQELNLSKVCRENGVTEKYINQVVKEQTGESFSSYLEKIRIERAKEYLIHTPLSNEKIAEKTGFSAANTFYRVFQKRTGVTPGAYRNIFGNRIKNGT